MKVPILNPSAYAKFWLRPIDEAIAKTHLLRYCSAHNFFFYIKTTMTQENSDFFTENY
jgi:hypothetical protein